MTPTRAGLVVSPADGIVEMITPAASPEELEMGDAPVTRISIFMNVFDVHVNRIPADGVITKLSYRPGKFVNASLDKASDDNERQSVRLATPGGAEVAFVQIAGLVARRILCELVSEQNVKAGERFGMIRFGSRVDLFLQTVLRLWCASDTEWWLVKRSWPTLHRRNRQELAKSDETWT